MSGLNSYPIFPNWAFEGEVPVSTEMYNEISAELQKLAVDKTEYGFSTQPNKLNNTTFNLNRIVGSLFFDNAVSYFQLNDNMRNIESVDSQFHVVKPGGHTAQIVNRHRWYAGAVFWSCRQGSSDIYLDMLDNKLYATPPSVQEYRHTIKNKKLKVAFWPAHLPWGISPNRSNQNDIIFTTTFIIKRG